MLQLTHNEAYAYEATGGFLSLTACVSSYPRDVFAHEGGFALMATAEVSFFI